MDHIAAPNTGLFHFLKNCKGQWNVVLGDARLTLEQSTDKFGVLIIDAFGSDSIPLHLLTREALQIYRDRLEPGGILAFHISNRYFHLEPILANLAHEISWQGKIRDDRSADSIRGKFASTWLIMAQELPEPAFRNWFPAARGIRGLRPWTDDFSNVYQVLKWARANAMGIELFCQSLLLTLRVRRRGRSPLRATDRSQPSRVTQRDS